MPYVQRLQLKSYPKPDYARIQDFISHEASGVGPEVSIVHVISAQMFVVAAVHMSIVENIEDVSHDVNPASLRVFNNFL